MINGVELKVGQVWLTRDNSRCVITGKKDYDPKDEYPWCGDIDGEIFTYTDEGKFYTSPQASDLIQLLEVVPEKSSVNSVNKTGNTPMTTVTSMTPENPSKLL